MKNSPNRLRRSQHKMTAKGSRRDGYTAKDSKEDEYAAIDMWKEIETERMKDAEEKEGMKWASAAKPPFSR